MIIDCKEFTTAVQLHAALAEVLHFPQWYGMNLDALYDCLTELEEPTELQLLNLPDWAAGFLAAMEDAMAENENFRLL